MKRKLNGNFIQINMKTTTPTKKLRFYYHVIKWSTVGLNHYQRQKCLEIRHNVSHNATLLLFLHSKRVW